MSRATDQRGFAMALLLWMIAGMSLTVAAVIHFARSDTSMAELRLKEAKARAIGVGVAHLLVRDRELSSFGPDGLEEQASDGTQSGRADDKTTKLFRKTYQWAGGVTVTAQLRPADGFIALNNADRQALVTLFSGLGKVPNEAAETMAEGVMEYRNEFPGFRYTEELLAVESASRPVYDSIKQYVHPYRSGSLYEKHAAAELAALYEGDNEANSSAGGSDPRGGGGSARGAVQGRITFESIAAAVKNQSGLGDGSISAAEIVLELPSGEFIGQTVWMGADASDPVIRVEPMKRARSGEP